MGEDGCGCGESGEGGRGGVGVQGCGGAEGVDEGGANTKKFI